MNYLKPEECVDGALYALESRNLSVGVYKADTKEFFGLRYKFDHWILDSEYHYDTGSPYGTAKPIMKIGDDIYEINEDLRAKLLKFLEK